MTIDIYRWRGRPTFVAVAMLVFAMLAVCNTARADEGNKWLDEYPKHVGFTWDADAFIHTNYLWRGIYVGGLCLQAEATVGYGGAFFNTWWNIGPTSWNFDALCPEVDTSIGFARWGFKVLFMHMYYFDTYSDGTASRFFDFSDPKDGVGGVTTEFRIGYKVSSKLPLSILWCTRFWGRDGYFDEKGERHRAYSTYIELGYDFRLPWELILEARLGMTPWKSFYTGFKGDFAVVNIGLTLHRSWKLTDYCSLRAIGQLMLNPWHIDKDNVQWHPKTPWDQRLNASVGVGVMFN